MKDPYEKLTHAIILLSVQDYRQSLIFLAKHKHTPALDIKENMSIRKLRRQITKKENERDDIERFFRSEWFCMLTHIDPEKLITRLKVEAVV